MITVEDVRRVALALPRTPRAPDPRPHQVQGQAVVYCAFSRDETLIGFAFPKEERDALVGGEPEKFLMPPTGDLRYHWLMARMSALDVDEMTELVTDAWRMVVPKSVAREHLSE